MNAASPSPKIPVTPYPHQVGGHGQLTMTHSGRILKPLLQKEKTFYQYVNNDELPPSMRWIRDFTPKYYGEAETPDNILIKLSSNHNDLTPSQKPVRPRLQPSASQSQSAKTTRSSDNSQILTHGTSDSDLRWRSTDGNTETSLSPWAAHMRFRSPLDSEENRKSRLSIKLEDINSNFIVPCVIDCKIGTRHYDDDASEEKRQRHIDKANSTTSASCGIRLTGMQSFKRSASSYSSAGAFESRDKYHGRKLRETDLVPQLTWFFHDNYRVRTDCVQQVLERICNLRHHLLQQQHFYFYSSSLLIVYEGALPENMPTRVDVRMIDFAHTVPSHGNRDEGYLKGVDCLISILSQILENETSNKSTFLPHHILKPTDSECSTASSPSVSHTDPSARGSSQSDQLTQEQRSAQGSIGFCENA